jgi:hypothetical protein
VVRALPLIHDKTVDEWGTEVLGYFTTGAPARFLVILGLAEFVGETFIF